MPINSFADIENMISAYKQSKTSQSHSTLACQGSFIEGTYNRSSYSSSGSKYPSNMSRSTRIIGVKDMYDENGYYNSSRQILK